MTTITDAEVGEVIATNALLDSIVLVTTPTKFEDDYFCLSDGEKVLYNIHVSTSAVSVGSDLMSGATIYFENLIVKSVPAGASFEVTTAELPTLDSLSPDTAVSGDPDLILSCIGTGFTKGTVIRFGDYDEPTTFIDDTEVQTGVKPSLFAPAVVHVYIHNGDIYSAPVDFTFTEPVATE